MIIECQKPNEIVKISASAKLAKESKYQKSLLDLLRSKESRLFKRKLLPTSRRFIKIFRLIIFPIGSRKTSWGSSNKFWCKLLLPT